MKKFFLLIGLLAFCGGPILHAQIGNCSQGASPACNDSQTITTSGATSISGTAVVTPVGSVAVSSCTAGAKYYYNGDGTRTLAYTGLLAGTCTDGTHLAVK